MKKLFLLSFLFLTSLVFSQQEASNWYFGSSGGIKFLPDGSTAPLPNSTMTAQHGCASISDENGNLLFYSNGENVWNRNHQIMSNGSGLFGSIYATQSALILKKTGSSNLYYVFTVDIVSGNRGLRYSEVDMNLDGGLGAVTVNKNIMVLHPSCEKIAAVKHANGTDYWLVTHMWFSGSFFVYQIKSSGVDYAPPVSNVGSPIYDVPAGPISASGGMKVSPDGTKLALCNKFSNIELFDFDAATGIISNAQVILNGNNQNYNVEFSSNSKVLYASLTTNGVLCQFDLTSANIASSRIEIARTYNANGDIQMGINGKIYLTAFSGTNKLSVINNPDVLGTDCDFQYNSVPMAGSQFYGLPAFCASIFNQSFTVKKTCLGDTTEFALTTAQSGTTAVWNFGDGSTTTGINAAHTYATAGTYTVSVSINGNTPKTKSVVISAVPTASKPQDLLVCDANNDGLYSFNLTAQNAAILNGQDPNLYKVTYFANAADYTSKTAIAAPNNYVNKLAYQQQTIIAEVSDKANGSCASTTSFDIAIFDTPKPSTVIPKISSCDNISVGTDADGRVVFDLTQKTAAILNGQSAAQFVISYYKDAALTQIIATPVAYQNTNPLETIYVKITNKDNASCFAVTSFLIEVLALPVITNVVDLKQCDDDIDGFSVFNLEEAINKITTSTAAETIAFFKSQTDALTNNNPITNITTYTNPTVSNDIVYVRVTNTNGCFRIAQLNLIVSTTQIPQNFTKVFTECDDAVSGTNTDGIASFDFSEVTNQIQNIFPAGQLLDIAYYQNSADALSEKNAITDITNYRNIDHPNTQKIYIRADSRLNNDCLGLGSHITLNVEKIPIVQPLIINHCDDNQDGKYAFDTSGIQTQLLNGLTNNAMVTYIDENNITLSSPLPNPFLTTSQTLKVIVTNSNTPKACSYDTTIAFVVDDLPEAFAVPSALMAICDDELNPLDQDGKYAFDTSTFEKTILGTQTGMEVNYFDGNNQPLSSPLPNPFITASQNVRAEVINPKNRTCTATVTLPFIVNPTPKINLSGDELVCSNLLSFTKVLDAGLLDSSLKGNYKYLWSFNGDPIAGASNYTLKVNTAGLYTVEVTNNEGCSKTRTITVSASDIAKITDVNITDLAESNNISVVITGPGDYVYSLDNENGSYQTESIFTNVSAGIHTVFVKDLNGCGVVKKEVSVLGIPDFFTPNNDGFNDYWNIKGVNTSFSSKTIIYIFDRYGKLIKQISPLTQGWDGTFNTQQMPASDYWYSIQLEDGRVAKGHFSLKR